MQDAIQRFINAADDFRSCYDTYREHGGAANCTVETPRGSILFNLLLALHRARRELETAGKGLPAILATRGNDIKSLLTFVNAVNVVDFERAASLWPEVCAELQQTAIIANLPQRAETVEISGAPPSKGDKKGDKKKMSPRGLTPEARGVARLYKTMKKADPKVTQKAAIQAYIDEHGGSFTSIKKTLSQNPEAWKTDNKRDRKRDKTI